MKKINITDKFYCIAIPGEGNFYEFWLFHSDYGVATLMFGCDASPEDVETMAINSAPDYYDSFYEVAGES